MYIKENRKEEKTYHYSFFRGSFLQAWYTKSRHCAARENSLNHIYQLQVTLESPSSLLFSVQTCVSSAICHRTDTHAVGVDILIFHVYRAYQKKKVTVLEAAHTHVFNDRLFKFSGYVPDITRLCHMTVFLMSNVWSLSCILSNENAKIQKVIIISLARCKKEKRK